MRPLILPPNTQYYAGPLPTKKRDYFAQVHNYDIIIKYEYCMNYISLLVMGEKCNNNI